MGLIYFGSGRHQGVNGETYVVSNVFTKGELKVTFSQNFGARNLGVFIQWKVGLLGNEMEGDNICRVTYNLLKGTSFKGIWKFFWGKRASI